ncbi:hypothetical protein BC939DRAFT_12569 [Gamsiella multidivaricata]|uniref:uncharacterized protein n=1 Tax=Gamsiella multidivaricata TaxID=101098 RepID=UPI00221EC354|nr:uncharacterized protein BC939DRAFT_12569 [Gamsiella multidivaricata]KAI7829603.1 hypothetical protein BC939DRAFT_12569 [Gamsiella multidivaricata]
MDIYEHQSSCAELKPVAIDVDADVNVGTGLGLITPEIAHSSTPSLLHPPLIHASSSTSATPATTTPTTYPASKLSVSRPPSPSLSASHLSVKNEHGGARAPSILSRHSSRAPSIQHVAATAAVLISNPTARRLRMNVYSELVRGWYYLSTSSKILLSYYIMATMVE